MNNIISIHNLYKNYGNLIVLNNINLDIKKGDFITIIGPSGCGKSTLLNILASVDNNYLGIVKVNDSMSYMLQKDALLPWLTNLENTLLPAKFNISVDKTYVINLFKKFKIENLLNSYPSTLSGGQRQRVALIRSLATHPKILLLDEPLSKLDYQTKLLIEKDIYDIVKNENITCIMISHDIEQSICMSDKVIVLSNTPSSIKKIYDIKLENKDNPINNRKDNKFKYYFNEIWKDLENE